jgi:hypothetical protein
VSSQALAAKQQQLAAKSSLLDQQLVATDRFKTQPNVTFLAMPLQALAAKQHQLTAESSLLEQQLVAAAGRRLELVQLRASLLERLGLFFGELQQQRQAEVEVINMTAAEVGGGGGVCKTLRLMTTDVCEGFVGDCSGSGREGDCASVVP